MVVGGINTDNVQEYFAAGARVCRDRVGDIQ